MLTEETLENSFAQALAGKISERCFKDLDAPVKSIGSKNLPAIPLNSILEKEMLPGMDEIHATIQYLLDF